MASRPKGFGLTAELARKTEAKYDIDQEQQALRWIREVVGEDASALDGVTGSKNVQEQLKDGVILCKLINCLRAGSVKKINSSKMAFKQMENIGMFLQGCENYGLNKVDLFQTVDLYEAQNMPMVITAVFALGRKAQTQGFDGPTLGPRESSENRREFTEEQLAEGKNVIGLQMGSNKGASQAGQSFGKTRHIVD